MSDPNAFVGRSAGAIHSGRAASASLVRQIPPPAAATQSRHGAPRGAERLPQLGSTANAVTRPDSCVSGPDCVAGSKNCVVTPATFGVTGPSDRHDAGACVARCRSSGLASNALRAAVASASSTYARGYARFSTPASAAVAGPFATLDPPRDGDELAPTAA